MISIMSNHDPEVPVEDPAEEFPMWKPKDPEQMVAEAVAPAGGGVAPSAPGEPHPVESVWIRHSSGLGDPQLISEHDLARMEGEGWEEMTDRPRLVEGPGGALIEKARQEPQEAPSGGEGDDD